MTLPLPFATAFLAGFFTLAGVWIASRLTSSREHRRWVSDNNKLEWRELIDQMHESFNRMQYAYISPPGVSEASDDSFDPGVGIEAGERIVRNRIFIADTLLRDGIAEHWEQLCKHTQKVMRSNSGLDLFGHMRRRHSSHNWHPPAAEASVKAARSLRVHRSAAESLDGRWSGGYFATAA